MKTYQNILTEHTCPWMGETDPGDTVRVKADFFCHVLTFRFEKDVFW